MKINREIIKRTEIEAKKYFKDSSGCHDWSHVERVKKIALHIGKIEKADLKILEIAALLHDIGREDEVKSKGKFCHAEYGAQKAMDLLAGFGLEKANIENITHAISTHRFRKGDAPETIEAKVLYDADKLDSIGAVGLARAFVFAGASGSGNIYTGNEKKLARIGRDMSFTDDDSAMLEYYIKLRKIKDKMLTPEGKRLAIERDIFMREFVNRFWQEVDGEI